MKLEKQSYALTMVSAFQAWESANTERGQQLLREARALEGPDRRPTWHGGFSGAAVRRHGPIFPTSEEILTASRTLRMARALPAD